MRWKALAVLALLCAACVSAPEDGSELPDVAAAPRTENLPWAGLESRDAISKFLEASIPYEMSNAHLLDELAVHPPPGDFPEAIGGYLEREDLTEIERFLLVRLGCRWSYHNRESDRAAKRTALLAAISRSLEAVRDEAYRAWLGNAVEDRACLRDLPKPRTKEAAASRRCGSSSRCRDG